MANANFLEEFDKSLQKLGQLNNIIAANTQKKKEYSEDIIPKKHTIQIENTIAQKQLVLLEIKV